ncbi:MAG: TonB-dependent receptor [Emticicia sp.]|nr:TonB-dependent receptor [Emticicia sp.]
MNKFFTKKHSLFLTNTLLGFLFVTMCNHVSFAQSIISGKVIDSDNAELIGVSIQVKGTNQGATTDAKGLYKVPASPNSTLVFSYVGYQAKEVVVGNQTIVNVVLESADNSLNEVVVLGYGTVRKSDLTASVSSVKGDVIKEFPVTSIDQALQGRVAGVQITQSSSAPGGGLSVRVRGANSILSGSEPLYVIDGLPIYPDNSAIGTGGNRQASSALAMLNPNDIESIEVLKDASGTAIYGSRGANGVVMITTKRGKSGASKVSYDGSYSAQTIARPIKMMRADDYMRYLNTLETTQGGQERFNASQISAAGAGTDWMDAITRTGGIQSHQLSFTGGTKATRYSVSGNYLGNEGVIKNTNFRRFGARVNIDNDFLKDRATLSNSWSFTNANSNNVPTDRGGPGGIIITALGLDPTVPVYNQAGEYNYPSYDGRFTINPLAEVMEGVDKDVTNRLLGTTAITVKIIDGLTFKTSFGLDLVNANRTSFFNRSTRLGRQNDRELSRFSRNVSNVIFENVFNYNKTIAKNHNIGATFGHSVQNETNSSIGVNTWGLPSDDVNSINLQNGAKPQIPFSGRQQWALESLLGRVNYSAYDKYLLTLTVRRDGSSRFGPNNKWATFPSAALGWKIANEGFFQNSVLSKVFSDFKIRASYGVTGNSNIPPYQSVSGLNTYNYVFNDQLTAGYAANRIPNADLKWESTAMTNIGINASLLNGKLDVSADWFNTKTTDLLLFVSIAQSTGFSSILLNSGTLTNKGMDFEANYKLVSKNDLKIDIGGNISFVRNKIVDLGTSTPYFAGSPSGHLGIDGSWVEAGNPIGVWRGFEYIGLFGTDAEAASYSALAGYPKYTDVNKDGKYTPEDYKIMGDPNPNFTFGLNTTVKYKNFDLGVFLRGVQGAQVRNLQQSEIGDGVQKINQIGNILTNSYSSTNTTGDRPAINGRRDFISFRKSSYFIEDGSFIRLQNLSLGYNIPVKSNYFRSARVSLSGQNLFLITKYTGFDPEVNNGGQSNLNRGDDYDAYPRAKTFTLGLNLGF